jgi:hypothetical protein
MKDVKQDGRGQQESCDPVVEDPIEFDPTLGRNAVISSTNIDNAMIQ